MVPTEQIALHNLATFKEVRLRALQESPSAFGSTYARERDFTDGEWKARLERWNGVRGIGFVAIDDGVACGIAGALLDEKDATHAQLVSMWTAPKHRRKGVGRLLVEEVMRWAMQRGVVVLQLMVTSKNESAMRFYEELGFTRTGRVEPYPNDASLVEYEMAREVGDMFNPRPCKPKGAAPANFLVAKMEAQNIDGRGFAEVSLFFCYNTPLSVSCGGKSGKHGHSHQESSFRTGRHRKG